MSWQGQRSAPVIFIMGQTGVGKSQFINRAVGRPEARVNDSLESIAGEPRVYNAGSVHLVDTPGFNDTNESDGVVLDRIVDWFDKSGPTSSSIAGSSFSGIIYLVEAKQRDLPMLQHLKEANQCLLVVMTKGKGKRKDVAVDCLFSDSQASAWDAIRAVLEKRQVEEMPVLLFFQKLSELAKSLSKSTSKSRRNKFSWKIFFWLRR